MSTQPDKSIALHALKSAQIVLATVLTGFFVLLLPGGVLYLIPLGGVYIVCAVRARPERKLSAWLAFLFTLLIAVGGGFLVASRLSMLPSGRAIPAVDFSIELTLFLLAAVVVVLHALNRRWLLAPSTENPVAAANGQNFS